MLGTNLEGVPSLGEWLKGLSRALTLLIKTL